MEQSADRCDVGRRESVVLKDLKDCSVYLLDYSGEVEVTNVQDSQIFIGGWTTPLCLLQLKTRSPDNIAHPIAVRSQQRA